MFKTLIKILLILFGMLILVMLESMRENHKFRITKYEIKSRKLPKSLDGYRIVMMSDLHGVSYGEDNERLIASVKELAPDAIILAGDMITGSTRLTEEQSKVASLVKELSHIADCYYGIGNHEKKINADDEPHEIAWSKYKAAITADDTKGNVYLLENEDNAVVREGGRIRIYGLDLDLKYYDKFSDISPDVDELNSLIGEADSNAFNILIAHNPFFFDSYMDWGADLALSGHVHGGLVRLPLLGGVISPKLRLFPKYDYGLYEKQGRRMIISNGLGSHSIKLRINNVPEVVLIHLSSN